MSSGTPQHEGAGRALVAAGATAFAPHGAPARLTERQLELWYRWRHYSCETYEGRRASWDGHQYVKPREQAMVAHQGFLPAGFYDAGQHLPLRLRRPTSPFYLARLVVQRFTSLLFSHRRHPKVTVEGDPETADYLNALANDGELWHRMIVARNLGGGQGTVAIGFKIVEGKVVFEVHDARWCAPKFASQDSHELAELEIRYPYCATVEGPKGQPVECWFWYRRLITPTMDVTWARVPANGDEEPLWRAHKSEQYEHDLGEVPVVWIHNQPVHGDVDGDADMCGAFEHVEAIDMLIAQAIKGTMDNADPTVVVKTERDVQGLAKGSDNALDVGEKGDAAYMEMAGSGTKAAWDLAVQLKELALQTVRCVIDQSRSAHTKSKTATEVEKDYSAMWEQADVLREQYGPHGVVRLLGKVERAIRRFDGLQELDVETGGTTRYEVKVPPRPVSQPKGPTVWEPRVLGPGGPLALSWPPYTTPTPDDISKIVEAAAKAKDAGLIDAEAAARAVAEIYGIEDVPAMLERIAGELKAREAALQDSVGDAMSSAVPAR